MRARFLSSACLAGFLALSAAAAFAQTTYFRGNSGDPETLDQHKTSSVVEAHLLRDLYEGLVIYDAAANVAPGVAESWAVSEDGRVYTFTLRADARWSNGDPVVAGDFVYSLRRIMDPATGAKYANILYPIKGAEAINKGEAATDALGVRAIDDRTLEITLEQPTPYFLELLTHQTGLPVHPATVEAAGQGFTAPGAMVSNGAYTLVSYTPNDRLVMAKNPQFHAAESVSIDQIVYLPFEDRATCVRRFEAGEVQSCSDLPAEQLGFLRENLGDQVRIAPYLGTYYFALNTQRAPLDDVRVRQALSMIIDREFLAEEIWSGAMLPAYGFVPPGIANYVAEPPRLAYADTPMFDREEEAIRLMTEAGYGPDNPIELEISYNISENHKATSTALADMWAPLGVSVAFNVRDISAHYAHLRDTDDYQVARAGWIGDYSDPQNFLFLVESDNDGFNYAKYRNADYDALLDKAAATVDLTARAEILKQAEEIFLSDMPFIPLLYYSTNNLVSRRIGGWDDNIQDAHATRFLTLE